MKKSFLWLLLATMLLAPIGADAQVTIGGNTLPNATLDVVATKTDGTTAEGVIAPRLTGDEIQSKDAKYTAAQTGAIVYVTAPVTTSSPKTINITTPGYYYFDGSAWKILASEEAVDWFYMPSIAIDVSTDSTFTRDLYLEYKKQFADTNDADVPVASPTPGTALVKSLSAPDLFTHIYGATELYYYVIGYDATVFSNISISDNGVMTYKVNADNVSDATYMNIVFKVK